MKLSLVVDWWDVAAIVAFAMLLVGAFSWHWQSGLIVVGLAVLVVYFFRESRLVIEPPHGSESEQR